MIYDMHMHSTYSDGTDNVETLIDNVKRAGIDFFSITDHDTAHSGREILSREDLKQKIHNLGLKYVVGTEWSCITEDGTKMHILAYDFDPFLPEVAEYEKQIKQLIAEKNEKRIQYVLDAGYKFSDKSLEFLKTRENIRKLDIAKCLTEDGYFEGPQEAIQQFLKFFEYKKEARLDAKTVVSTLSKLGAKMVWAHSIHGLNEKPLTFEKIDEVVASLVPFGLVGLECYYSLYNSEEIEKLNNIAEKYGLFVTVGSDYHGTNKYVKLAETSVDGTKVDESRIKFEKVFKNIIE